MHFNPEKKIVKTLLMKDILDRVLAMQHSKLFLCVQGFLSFSQVEPKKGKLHSHLYCPFSAMHLPAFLHGDDLQGSVMNLR